MARSSTLTNSPVKKSAAKALPKATAKSAAKSSAKARRTSVWRTAKNSDRHELYELAVQEVESECDFIDTVWKSTRGRLASTLREDFCGTAKACTEWARRRPSNHAVGVDLDRSVIRWGELRHRAHLPLDISSRITVLEANVLDVETPNIDTIVAMNFSYFIFKERAQLVHYFRRVFESLAADGLFICDAYGGSESHSEVEEERHLDGFTYVWDQNVYNPVTNDVLNHIHFRFPDGSEIKRAFTYSWRLWSLPEIQEALKEAGFAATTVYWEGTDRDGSSGNGVFKPSTRGEACAGWIAYIVAQKSVAKSRAAKPAAPAPSRKSTPKSTRKPVRTNSR